MGACFSVAEERAWLALYLGYRFCIRLQGHWYNSLTGGMPEKASSDHATCSVAVYVPVVIQTRQGQPFVSPGDLVVGLRSGDVDVGICLLEAIGLMRSNKL
jgi:hypothetical protein